jgi:predicted O-methyltransferase YrrM
MSGVLPVFVRLVPLYEQRGFEVATGHNPCHMYGEPNAPFTYLFREDEAWTSAAGIAPFEISLLEALASGFSPRHILIIGNSFGWSALAMAMAFPRSRVVAIDTGEERNASEGLLLTNRIASEEGFGNLIAVKARSPDDLAHVSASHAGGPWDMVFIDGEHTPRQVALDFEGARPFAAADSLWLFHDALNFGLLPAIRGMGERSGMIFQPLWRTPSGMAALVTAGLVPNVAATLHAFSGSDATFQRQRSLGHYGATKDGGTAPACPDPLL